MVCLHAFRVCELGLGLLKREALNGRNKCATVALIICVTFHRSSRVNQGICAISQEAAATFGHTCMSHRVISSAIF